MAGYFTGTEGILALNVGEGNKDDRISWGCHVHYSHHKRNKSNRDAQGIMNMTAAELLEKYTLVELAILYSMRPHCRVRNRMVGLAWENLLGIVRPSTRIEIAARMFKAMDVRGNRKHKLYEDALERLDRDVERTARRIQRS